MKFGSLNLYLKWEGAKMSGAGEFCMFFLPLGRCSLWFSLTHVGAWRGPWDRERGFSGGRGERQFLFRACSLLECRVGSSQSLLREQRRTEYRARAVLEPWRWNVCHVAASPRRGLPSRQVTPAPASFRVRCQSRWGGISQLREQRQESGGTEWKGVRLPRG